MKDRSPQPPIDPKIEARIVALVLGEASDFERDELEQLIAHRPELAAFKKEVQETHAMMLDVGSDEPLDQDASWKLPDEKRNKVLAVIDSEAIAASSEPPLIRIAEKPTLSKRSWLIGLSKIAAVLLVGGFLLSMLIRPILSSTKVAYDVSPKTAVIENPAGRAGYYKDFGGEALSDEEIVMSTVDAFSANTTTESSPATDFKSALSSIRDSLATGETTTRTTLPSPYYLQDDVQYFPSKPQSELTREAAELKTPRFDDRQAPEQVQANPNPSRTAEREFSFYLPITRGQSSSGSESPDISQPTLGEKVQPDLSYPTAETATPSRFGLGILGGKVLRGKVLRGKVLRGKVQRRWDENTTAEMAAESPAGIPNSQLSVAKQLGANQSAGSRSSSSTAKSEDLRLPSIGKQKGIDSRGSETWRFSGIASEANEGTDDDRAPDQEIGMSDVWKDSEMEMMDMGMGMGMGMGMPMEMGIGGFAGGVGEQTQVDDTRAGLTDRPDMDFGMPPQARHQSGGEERFRSWVPPEDPASSPVESKKAIEPGAGNWYAKGFRNDIAGGRDGQPDSNEGRNPGPALDQAFDPSFIPYFERRKARHIGPSPTNASGLVKDRAMKAKDREKTAVQEGAIDRWEAGQQIVNGTTFNSPDARNRFLAEKQSQLTDELRSKEITLKQVEEIVASTQDPSVALNVAGKMLGVSADRVPKAEGFAQEMRNAEATLGNIEVDKQLIPLMIELNRQAAQFGEKHPSVNELDSELKAMKSELKRLVQEQTDRTLELIKDSKQKVGEPNTKAAEAVASLIYAAKAEVELLKVQIADIEHQASRELLKTTVKAPAKAAGLNEKMAQNEAFSTFSLHVSDVSFKLAQASLSRGEWPEAAKIRIEEFVNAFDYGDPMPNQNEQVACRVEQCIHPFLQQRNLMRVSMRTAAAGRAGSTPLRLTFLLDNSGSMERIDRQQTVRRAFALLAQQLKPIDQVTVISFARQPRLLADNVNGEKSRKLVQLVETLPSEGGTNIEAALQLAFEKAREQHDDKAQNRIILLTDGAVNLGNANPESLSQMITSMRDAGIAFDAAGIGAEGLNDEVLEALTRKGDGRYYLLDSVDDADEGFVRQIAGALRPSAKNVKVQIEFNPKRVGRYKLLGFEKHLLKKEDFRNDKVDAAEMAAAEAGVAVYQFQAKPDGEGDIGSVFVRFQDLSSGRMIENSWPIPYQCDAPRVDQAAVSLRIATSAVMLAAKLQGEPLGATVDLKTLSSLISGLPDQVRGAKRVQQLQLMIQKARQVSGN